MAPPPPPASFLSSLTKTERALATHPSTNFCESCATYHPAIAFDTAQIAAAAHVALPKSSFPLSSSSDPNGPTSNSQILDSSGNAIDSEKYLKAEDAIQSMHHEKEDEKKCVVQRAQIFHDVYGIDREIFARMFEAKAAHSLGLVGRGVDCPALEILVRAMRGGNVHGVVNGAVNGKGKGKGKGKKGKKAQKMWKTY